MNSMAPEQDWFSASEIAHVAGRHKKYWQRVATREQWPARRNGNRMEFQPPPALAECLLKVGRQASGGSPLTVRFADLAHDQKARDLVLLREQAVSAVLNQLHTGKETALQSVCTVFRHSHPDLRISTSSLRRWVDHYTAAGLDGLVEQKRGRVGRKGFANDLTQEQILQLAAEAVGHGNWKRNNETRRVNVARAYQNLVANPTLSGPARVWAHGGNASKSYVPPSVRRAVQASVSPLAASLMQIGPKAMKLDGPHSECTYADVPAGHAFTADDMTANVYVWTEWPNEQGFLLIRPQILAVMDIGSLAWLNLRAIIRPRGQYNKDDVWGLIGDTLDNYGVFQIAVLEGGTWQSNVVIGEKTGLDDSTRIGGLKSLGTQVIHTRTPRGKIIEGEFNKLQHAADNVRGYCGRDERVDCPEEVKRNLYAVEKGHAHPRQFFLHLKEYTDHLTAVMTQLNGERNDGKVLRGMTPLDKWAQDNPQMTVLPDESKWMYRSAFSVREVTRNGVRITVGSGRYQLAYTYAHPALEVHRGRRVVVFWNDAAPDTDAVVYTVKNGKPDQLICVASRVKELPRFGATDEDFKAEATRKKLQAQVAVTQSRTLAPYLQRRTVAAVYDRREPGAGTARQGIGADTAPLQNDVGAQLAAVREANEQKQKAQARTRRLVARAADTSAIEADVDEMLTQPTAPAMSDERIAELLGDNPLNT